MLRLRLKNPVPLRLAHHYPFSQQAPDSPWKPRIHVPTNRMFHVVSLPQKDGSYVASVVEAPGILVYDESRETRSEERTSELQSLSLRYALPILCPPIGCSTSSVFPRRTALTWPRWSKLPAFWSTMSPERRLRRRHPRNSCASRTLTRTWPTLWRPPRWSRLTWSSMSRPTRS